MSVTYGLWRQHLFMLLSFLFVWLNRNSLAILESHIKVNIWWYNKYSTPQTSLKQQNLLSRLQTSINTQGRANILAWTSTKMDLSIIQQLKLKPIVLSEQVNRWHVNCYVAFFSLYISPPLLSQFHFQELQTNEDVGGFKDMQGSYIELIRFIRSYLPISLPL